MFQNFQLIFLEFIQGTKISFLYTLIIQYISILNRLNFFKNQIVAPQHWKSNSLVQPNYPDRSNPEYFVHITLLMAIVSNYGKNIVVLDVGAGWGKWLTIANAAANQL
jgi:hypothetical protein